MRPYLRSLANEITLRKDDVFEPFVLSDDVLRLVTLSHHRLNRLLRLGKPEEYATVLHALELHYPRPDMDEGRQRVFWEQMMDDVSDIPLIILEEAARRYRNDPLSRFFPRAGQLRGHIQGFEQEARDARDLTYEILAYNPPKRQERLTPERMAEIRAEVETAKSNDV